MTKIEKLSEREISATELFWQIKTKYAYLASLYSPGSVEREVFLWVRKTIDMHLSMSGAVAALQQRIQATKKKIADVRWKPEYRERWEEEVCGFEQVVEDLERLGGTVELVECIQQRIKERLGYGE